MQEQKEKVAPKYSKADCIRAMSDEELVDMIFKYGVDEKIAFCKKKEEYQDLDKLDFDSLDKECRKCMLEWLKQPAED